MTSTEQSIEELPEQQAPKINIKMVLASDGQIKSDTDSEIQNISLKNNTQIN